MMKFIKNFRKDEDGAVTVDWVVLTAAVVGLAVAAYQSIENGATALTASTGTFLTEQDPGAAAAETSKTAQATVLAQATALAQATDLAQATAQAGNQPLV
eukprot:CAMPEP_0181170892 /NCGR_PEP_ID=MMETSP1096-20121128/1611_1 /TAXON_ID=156174 ORGANISM="Chrysochromulina ericina, Strain CCMP281" /NCGR_SAMPLE_ID=MMETSP1096 /ASSEMBLY_ACC=CAM_ASM_000453 /LENGTH=99 /DNA_ID=CAMNT_0023258489 /DNA_START=75 /DNA_END=375 /DNA_ORIENTATION=-